MGWKGRRTTPGPELLPRLSNRLLRVHEGIEIIRGNALDSVFADDEQTLCRPIKANEEVLLQAVDVLRPRMEARARPRRRLREEHLFECLKHRGRNDVGRGEQPLEPGRALVVRGYVRQRPHPRRSVELQIMPAGKTAGIVRWRYAEANGPVEMRRAGRRVVVEEPAGVIRETALEVRELDLRAFDANRSGREPRQVEPI